MLGGALPNRVPDEALTEAYERYLPLWTRFAERLVGSAWAEELVHDTFYRICDGDRTLEAPEDVNRYTMRALGYAAGRFRAARRRRRLPLDEVPPDVLADGQSPDTPAIVTEEAEILFALILEVLDDVPPEVNDYAPASRPGVARYPRIMFVSRVGSNVGELQQGEFEFDWNKWFRCMSIGVPLSTAGCWRMGPSGGSAWSNKQSASEWAAMRRRWLIGFFSSTNVVGNMPPAH